MLLARTGPLPGSAAWTHEHADAANTRVSRDRLVKAPLGLLWFGGPAHDGVLPMGRSVASEGAWVENNGPGGGKASEIRAGVSGAA